jgi:hypothetical protein
MVSETPLGRLAQLVRAPALHAGCRRFESVTAYHFLPDERETLGCGESSHFGGYCCLHTAFWGNSPFANDWQWVIGNPITSAFGAVFIGALGAIAPTIAVRLAGPK